MAHCYVALRLGSLLGDGSPMDFGDAHPVIPQAAAGLVVWEVARRLLGLLLNLPSRHLRHEAGAPLASASSATLQFEFSQSPGHSHRFTVALAGIAGGCCSLALQHCLRARSQKRARLPDGACCGVVAGVSASSSTTSASGSVPPASTATDDSAHQVLSLAPPPKELLPSSSAPVLSKSDSQISLSPWLTKTWSQDSFESVESVLARADKDVQLLVHELIARNTSLENLAAPQTGEKTCVNKLPDIQSHIRVFCRIRPVLPREEGRIVSATRKDELTAEIVRPQTTYSGMRQQTRLMQFDAVFGPAHSQEDVFEEVQELVQSAVDGYNVTILSYGQTGAGKTYTMYGHEGDHRGIAPRTIEAVFAKLRDLDAARFCPVVSVNLVELYNNNFRDLLNHPARSAYGHTSLHSTHMGVRRESRAGECATNLAQDIVVSGVEELQKLLQHGIGQRHVASTVLNPDSSRSHMILTISLDIFDKESQARFMGKIRICDLAGAERQKKTGATGEAMKEAIEINKALTALGDVIESVARSKGPVSYRSHKLTHLLSDSLGGSAKTAMFVNVSPCVDDVEETLNALAYASRVRNITNNITHNVQ